MKNILFKTLLAGSLILFGAGCQPKPVPPVTPPTPVAPAPVTPPPAEPPAATSTSHSSSTITTIKPSMPLAFPGEMSAAEVNKKVRIKTNQGDIVIQVSRDMGPKAASNFVYLVKNGFYNGTIFHRVIPGFMVQGGDPTGSGMGGPGYKFANDKVNDAYSDGVVAMANAGRDTNGSQFFIMVADYPLPPDYSVFGKVVQGLDVVHKIAAVNRDSNDRPYDEVKMIDVKIEE